MKTELSWEKGLLSNDYCIFDNDKQIGFIKKNFFSKKSFAEINGEKYEFQERRFFRKETNIVDTSKNKIIGKIKYNTWGNKAFIELNNENFTWEYKNIWGTKWLIHNSKGVNILYYGSFSNGQIDANEDDTIKLILGLYVNIYNVQMWTAFILCVSLPQFLWFLR